MLERTSVRSVLVLDPQLGLLLIILEAHDAHDDRNDDCNDDCDDDRDDDHNYNINDDRNNDCNDDRNASQLATKAVHCRRTEHNNTKLRAKQVGAQQVLQTSFVELLPSLA